MNHIDTSQRLRPTDFIRSLAVTTISVGVTLIGVTGDLSIDLLVDKPLAGDIYLLCSDGLNKMVDNRQIQQVLATQRDLEAAVYGLIELANDAGGKDNVTVVLIKVLDRTLHDTVA